MNESNEIEYSQKFQDDSYEYRIVQLPQKIFKKMKRPYKIYNEQEWRNLGITQSPGWQHHDFYHAKPYILMFRRPILSS